MSEKRSALKEALYDTLIHVVQNGTTAVDKDGNVVNETATAPYLQAAIALLKVEDLPESPKAQTLGAHIQRLQKARPGQPAVN